MAKKHKRKQPDADGPGQASIKLTRKEFEKELYHLQVELTRLQAWTVAKGARVIVVFEGRDTAGKGGVIKRITERCSPRVFRHVALPAPSDREKSQLYIQRYMAHFPAAGEIILFDRSWYNRAGVERVMGFCTDDQYEHFLKLAPAVERELVNNGIILLKYFLDVSQDEQRRRFEARIEDPVKHWKLSPMDVEFGPALVGLHAGLPGDDRGDRQPGGPLVHRAGRRQAPCPAEPDPAPARSDPLSQGRGRPAEDPEGAGAAKGRRGWTSGRPSRAEPLLREPRRWLRPRR